MGYLSRDELSAVGLQSIGEDVRVSSRAVIYNPGRVSLGDHCRIDDFCLLSAGEGGISIGRYVHIGCYTSLIGAAPIVFEDLSGTSGRVSIYSSSDDFSGAATALPTVPEKYRKVVSGEVRVCRHVVIGAGAVVLPGVTINLGAAIGALALIQKDCEPFGVYTGNPARKVSFRSRSVLKMEHEILRE